MDYALRYSIFDPSGNITALVESPCSEAEQPAIAEQIMAAHPEVEQVGFVRVGSGETGIDAELRMAGGEFCGNASLCAAALVSEAMGEVGKRTVRLRVSGTAAPVVVVLEPSENGGFDGEVRMPRVVCCISVELAFGNTRASLPVVHFEGIAHAIIGKDSPFFSLLENRGDAEAAVRTWCEALGADSLGLMFLDDAAPKPHLTPLVFVPKSGTLFWESSCASGSAATGIVLAERARRSQSFSFIEPGGTICVASDSLSGDTWLYGSVRRRSA